MSPPPDATVPIEQETGLTPEQTLALIDRQRERVDAELGVDPTRLYTAWGTAWLVGFGSLYGTSGTDPLLDASHGAALGLFFALQFAATVVTVVHIARTTRGVRGVSATSGAMYGWSWLLGFATLPVVISSVEELGAPPLALDLLWTALPGILVGVLYMIGGALWQDRTQFALGAWILASTTLGTAAGLPAAYLVMSLAGGGGFLFAAVWLAARRRPGHRAAGAGPT